MVSDVGSAVNGFVEYVAGILRDFSGAGRDEQVAVGCAFVGLLLILISLVLFVVLQVDGYDFYNFQTRLEPV